MFYNGWISTNLGSPEDFYWEIKNKTIKFHSYDDALSYNVEKIVGLNKPIYVAFSGGTDSEYIVRLFHKMRLNFKAISIVAYNNEEMRHAYETAKELGIDHIILNMSDVELMRIIFRDIFLKYRSIGMYSAHEIMASYYVKDLDGILVSGTEVLRIENKTMDSLSISLSDYDIYPDGLIDSAPTVPFFIYTADIFKAYLIETLKYPTLSIDQFKSAFYNVKYRVKTGCRYPERLMKHIYPRIDYFKKLKRHYHIIGNAQETLKLVAGPDGTASL